MSDTVQVLTPYPGTHAEISALENNGKVLEGRTYKITNRGDRGIILTGVIPKGAIGQAKLSRFGIRQMQIPLTYAEGTFAGLVWRGVWKATNLPAVGDLCIWGGLVWANLTGANGSPTNDYALDATNWVELSKGAINADLFYMEKDFKICYEIKNDWINKQWDDQGNIMGIDFAEQSLLYAFTKNPVDITDWNYETAGVIFANNSAIGIYNNYVQTFYSSSSSYSLGAIENNHIPGVIANNVIPGYYGGSITGNTNDGSITGNSCAYIADNSCKGTIDNNTNTGGIYNNSNLGGMSKNGPRIRAIFNNSNRGQISNNNCNGSIFENSNNGNIAGNGVTVGITTTNIFLNANNGDIRSNNNVGSIDQNDNNGDILNATSLAAAPVRIFLCHNNGTVGTLGPYAANVTQAAVNL